jgi:hypothetical protein
MLGQHVNKLVFFVVRKTATPFDLQKREIISGQEFQRTTKVPTFLANNCLLYVAHLTWSFVMGWLDGRILAISPAILTMEQV